MMKRNAIATAILLCTSTLFVTHNAVAQDAVFIGSVKDTQSQLSGALISIVGTDKSTVTNYQGQFELPQLDAGNYQLKVSYLGYQPYFIDLTIAEGEIQKLQPITLFAAKDDNTIEEVIALGQIQRGEMAAANNQKNAKSIKNIISADGIGKLPDRNAAEAVQRIPGVSIERDQGEGRFVAVRGLPAQWSSASINGDRLPTAEEETTSRATAFDFFPSELIEFVEVSKALTPDMEGDAIGGNVNFITKKAPDDFVLNTNFAIGQNELAGGTNYSANVLYGDRLLDDKLGFLINATAWQRDWATDNFEPRRGDDGIGVHRLELRDYTGTRETYGLNGAVEYQLDQGTISATAMYGSLVDDETHYKHRMRFDKDRAEVQHIRNELITEMTGFEFAGEHYFGYDKTLNWKLSSYENEFRYGNTPNGEDNSYFVVRFDQKNVGYQGLEDRNTGKNYAYNTIDGGNDPWNAMSNHLPSDFSFDPDKTQLSWVQLYKVFVNEKDKIVASTDFEWQLDNDLTLKVGAKYRDKERVARFSDEFYAWDEANYGPAPTLSDFTLADQPGRSDYLDKLPIDYQSQLSQVASTDDLAQFWNMNKDKFILDKSESALIENGGALGRNFDVSEQHTSLYGMATYTINSQWEMLGGLRLTQTDTNVDGYIYLADENRVEPSSAKNDYLSVLPALHVTYHSTEQTNYRLALTRSFSRPDFGSLTPGATYLEAENELVTGNPELNPTYSNNIDLMAEHFFERVGLVSAGFFYKDISDPIFQSSTIGDFGSNSGVNIIRPENGESAWLAGIEMAFNRDLGFVTPALENFGVMANATFMDSQMSIPNRDDKVAIPRQADSLYNFTLYYDDTFFAARIAVNYKGEYIEEHGSNSQSDSYYGDNTSVDFTTSYQLNENALVYLELNNLTNEPLKYYLGDESRPLQVEYYGVRGMVGINYQF
ncbi:TonB-dependent receptor [Pseudoalteromonas arctica]|uniref:TonB-dependent receptor n=1 Tax=Pseudoalteromonas arctica TaxID=394751 RepID=A0A7Y0DUE0_9GAMM|nr:TonB-dependent receptor [Pseudoalteromonas arctica]NMM41803.1 TonB-dependent receptor [Pseudoalteromonas arctica]